MISNTMSIWHTVVLWFDSYAGSETDGHNKNVWLRILPFIVLHLSLITLFFIPVNGLCITLCVVSYMIKMFGITGVYHRYLSHKSYKTSRIMQFILSAIGSSAAQRGPLWWVSHHRAHHKYSDTELDHHSPKQRGFWYSHVGWLFDKDNFKTDNKYINDLLKYKELILLDRFDSLVPLFFVGVSVLIGVFSSSITILQSVIWGSILPTVLVYHATFGINSIAHLLGSRSYETKDDSRNNFVLALLTMGEGWHNNHHFYPQSVRQGFKFFQIDVTYYILFFMSKLGLIWDLKVPSKEIINRNLMVNAS